MQDHHDIKMRDHQILIIIAISQVMDYLKFCGKSGPNVELRISFQASVASFLGFLTHECLWMCIDQLSLLLTFQLTTWTTSKIDIGKESLRETIKS